MHKKGETEVSAMEFSSQTQSTNQFVNIHERMPCYVHSRGFLKNKQEIRKYHYLNITYCEQSSYHESAL